MSKYEGHTPGPWEVFCDDDDIDYYPGINSRAGYSIIMFGDEDEDCGVQGRSRVEILANAALIAAAPDLLAERDKLKAENKRLRHDLERANNALADERELPTIAYMSGAADAKAEIRRLKAINAELVEALVKIEGAAYGLYGDAEQSLSIIGGIVGEALIKAKEQDDDQ
jgi:hypothetical protein